MAEADQLSENGVARTGLLDLSVELSSPEIYSDTEFTVYLHIKNPFDVPVYIKRVDMSLPSQMYWRHQWESRNTIISRKSGTELEKQATVRRFNQVGEIFTRLPILGLSFRMEDRVNQLQDKVKDHRIKLSQLQKELSELSTEDNDFRSKRTELNNKISETTSAMEADEQLLFASLGYNFVTSKDSGEVTASDLDLSAPVFLRTEASGKITLTGLQVLTPNERRVPLTGALPQGHGLRQGNTDVWTILLGTHSNWFFIPAQYKLKFNVIYTFIKPSNNEEDTAELPLYINTTSQTLNIRTSIWSIMMGALVGGIFGSLARDVQMAGSLSNLSFETTLIHIVVSTVLSVAAVIFAARKSDTQSFISIEDFWGGALIGFLGSVCKLCERI